MTNEEALARQIKYRPSQIDAADGHVEDCARFTAEPPDASPEAARLWRRSAKLLEMAAEWYRHAGLGLLAKATFGRAADCYDAVAEERKRDQCRRKADAIAVHYEYGEE